MGDRFLLENTIYDQKGERGGGRGKVEESEREKINK